LRLDERQRRFIDYLRNLAREGDEDRGALADLRSGLGKEPGEMARVHKHVVPYLPEKNHDDRWYYLTATLFGMHPKHKEPVEHRSNGKKWKEVWTVGRAFRPLAFPINEPKKGSMEARFVALLNAHPDDLGDHLRHIVRLLESAKPPQPLDWFRLFDDVLQWDHPEGHVQLRWARDFYRGNRSETGSATDTNHSQLS
jgi:CRISPR system Cascade subunit CasB